MDDWISAFVASVVCQRKNKKRMKLDQLLRAHDAGSSRSEDCPELSTYDMRKRYGKLYYHFKPGKVYWMLLILARKASIVAVALLFRRNVIFLLSCLLMVLFASYILQVSIVLTCQLLSGKSSFGSTI